MTKAEPYGEAKVGHMRLSGLRAWGLRTCGFAGEVEFAPMRILWSALLLGLLQPPVSAQT